MTHDEIEKLLETTLKDLSALPEEQMRLCLIGRRLNGIAPDDAAVFFNLLFRKNPQAGPVRRFKDILVNHEGMTKTLGEEACKLIYMSSIKLGLDKISRLFTNLPPKKKGLSGYDNEEDGPMEMITLGQRRSMAKSSAKNTLDRLLHDSDPVVIAYVLDNPRIIEKDILKIASKRPNSARILKLIAGHRKWSKRYAVVKAIAQNPYTQPRISIALLEMLMTQDLADIAEDKTVHPQVKLSARDIVEDRNSRDGK